MLRLALRVLFGLGCIAALLFLASIAGDSDRRDCEYRLAKELNTTAVYVNNRCMVKGYGRADGR